MLPRRLPGALLGLVPGNIRLPALLPAGSSRAADGGANDAVSGLAAAAGIILLISGTLTIVRGFR